MSTPLAVLDRALDEATLVAPAPARPQPPLIKVPKGRDRAARSQVRQLIVGLMALPLTVLPFIAYLTLTPEGRLVRDRALVTLRPPTLPTLSPEQVAAAVAVAPRYEGAVMALAYHGIGSASDGEGGFVMSATRFAEHLATLEAAGMQTVTAAQVAAAFTGGEPLPPNAVMLSFDDGRADAMMFADPLLAEAGMSATMFVIAGAASEPGIYYASWDRIESYARSGRWDIQSHTAASHREHEAGEGGSLPALTSLAPNETLDEYAARIGEDLAKASSAIKAHTGRAPVAFAYPFGAYGADRTNDPAVATVLREAVARHHAVAFQQDDQDTVPLLTPEHDLLRLRRVEVQNWSGIELLQRIDRARELSTASGERPAPPTDVAAEMPLATPAGEPSTPSTTVVTGGAARDDRAQSTATPPTAPGVVPAAVITPPLAVPGPPVNPPPPSVLPVTPTTAPPPTTSPPTTVRPTTPTTRPPTTSPPTTACKPAGKSGKCVGG